MRLVTYILLMICLLTGISCSGNKRKVSDHAIPVVNVGKSHPVKKVSLQELADIEYLPLETREDFLWFGWPVAISHQWIANYNFRSNNIHLFSRQGKAEKRYNRSGGGAEEYSLGSFLVFDEQNEESFIYDNKKKHIFVYDLEGNFQRSFPYREDTYYHFMTNLDKDRLIGYHRLNDPKKINTYHILSKQTGELEKEISLQNNLPKITQRMTQPTNDGRMLISTCTHNALIQHKQGFILNDLSNDTLFLLSPTLETQPFLIRTPHVGTLNPDILITSAKETEAYIYIETVEKTFDFEKSTGYPYTEFLYDKKEGKTYRLEVYNKDFPDQKQFIICDNNCMYPSGKENQATFILNAIDLLDALEKGRLYGKLAEIAKNLDEEDNPVLMIATLK